MYHRQPCQLWCQTWSCLSCCIGFSNGIFGLQICRSFDYTLQVTHLVLVWYIFCECDKNLSSFACKSWSKCFYSSCLGWWLSCTLRGFKVSWCFQFWGSPELSIEELKEKQVLHSLHHELWLAMSRAFVPSSGLLLDEVLAILPQHLKLPRFHGQVYLNDINTPHRCPEV